MHSMLYKYVDIIFNYNLLVNKGTLQYFCLLIIILVKELFSYLYSDLQKKYNCYYLFDIWLSALHVASLLHILFRLLLHK